MSRPQKQKQQERVEVSGLERLALRVSSMINHPIAQLQRWVTIHRLDTDGEEEWAEVMGILTEIGGIEMIFKDEGESVTLKWEPTPEDERPAETEFEPAEHEAAPF
ncbi:DUF1654 domain-containing protein [Pseudomonas sp. IT-P218]|uniref:DUF1654 domain-containing protein n=1 Tax=Pseudomonas sp. IT-P218 TaxID=3026449 RepID=UPI0039E03FB8